MERPAVSSELALRRTCRTPRGLSSRPATRELPDPATRPYHLSEEQRAALKFPALAWLDELFAAAPSATKAVAFMPVHVVRQPPAGTAAAAVEQACKDTIVAIAKRHGATVI